MILGTSGDIPSLNLCKYNILYNIFIARKNQIEKKLKTKFMYIFKDLMLMILFGEGGVMTPMIPLDSCLYPMRPIPPSNVGHTIVRHVE
jgi:hypothetical protein